METVHRISIQEKGLVGALHLPEKQGSFPLVITLGGFRGGCNEVRAEKLCAHGFAAISLAYFGSPGLPAFQDIPLEYFEQAIAWAYLHPCIDLDRIGLWGVSRGAELSLILGALFPSQIKAIVATVPSSAVYGSIVKEAPAWLLCGQPFRPNAPFFMGQLDPNAGKTAESALALTPYFLEGMKNKIGFEASKIPVEAITCPLLLISGENDLMWPSSVFCEQILERLQAKDASIFRSHFSYPGAGHAISSSDEIVELHPVTKIWFAFGGNARDNALAKADSWEKTLQFFRSWI